MLYIFNLLQCFLYLVIAPLVGRSKDLVLNSYSIVLSCVVIFMYFLATLFYKKGKPNKLSSEEISVSINYFLLFLIQGVALIVSLKYGLYNSRIGSEEAALLRSQINPVELIFWRLAYLIFWLTAPIIILDLLTTKTGAWKGVLILVFASISIGILSSRASPILVVIFSIIVLQNIKIRISPIQLLSILIFGVAGVVIRAVITETDFNVSDYMIEIFDRVDGLKILALYLIERNLDVFSFNMESLDYFLRSLNPFSEDARYLKSVGKTGVKNYILEAINLEQLDSVFFFNIDTYVIFGTFGVMIASFVLGVISRFSDFYILSRYGTSDKIIAICMTITCTLLSLESELVGLLKSFFINSILALIIYKYIIKIRVAPVK